MLMVGGLPLVRFEDGVAVRAAGVAALLVGRRRSVEAIDPLLLLILDDIRDDSPGMLGNSFP